VPQSIGFCSFKTFWMRHVRWGRIRRAQFTPAFYLEPVLFYAFGSGWLGAAAFYLIWCVPVPLFMAIHIGLWGVADMLLVRHLEGRVTVGALLGWFLRELMAVPHWLHMAASNRISWRGHPLRILSGGRVEIATAKPLKLGALSASL